jgi:hypothetical protein
VAKRWHRVHDRNDQRADLMRDAAGRAKELWPAPDLPDWPGTGAA